MPRFVVEQVALPLTDAVQIHGEVAANSAIYFFRPKSLVIETGNKERDITMTH